MKIEVAPETEKLVREEIRRGHFRSVDELILAGVEALRDKHILSISAEDAPLPEARNLVELFEASPLRGLSIEFERDRDYGREIEL